MPKYGTAGTATGQAFRVPVVNTEVTSLPLPSVAEVDLLRKAHPVNIAELSGKRAGAMVMVHSSSSSDVYVAVATGSLPESPWVTKIWEKDLDPVA